MNVLRSETKPFDVYIFEIIYTFPVFLNIMVTVVATCFHVKIGFLFTHTEHSRNLQVSQDRKRGSLKGINILIV